MRSYPGMIKSQAHVIIFLVFSLFLFFFFFGHQSMPGEAGTGNLQGIASLKATTFRAFDMFCCLFVFGVFCLLILER